MIEIRITQAQFDERPDYYFNLLDNDDFIIFINDCVLMSYDHYCTLINEEPDSFHNKDFFEDISEKQL